MRLSVTTTSILMLAFSMSASAQVEWTTTGAAVVESFTGYTGVGLDDPAPAGGLSSQVFSVTGMSDGSCDFGASCTLGDFARGASTGGVSSAGLYSFDVGSGNTVFGVQPAGSDFTPGTVTYRIQNNAGAITDVDLSFQIWAFNDQARANSLTVEWSVDDVNYTALPALDYTTIEAADIVPAWTMTPRFASIDLGLVMQPATYFYVRFSSDDVSGAGSRDEIAIDDISTTPYANLAAELTDFSALSGDDGMTLRWTTASEENLSGFDVELARADGQFVSIGFVPAQGAGSYEFATMSRRNSSTYRLKIVDVDGSFKYSPAIETVVELSTPFVLDSAFPNPFSNRTSLTLSVRQEQSVTVELFDVLGRHVDTPFSGSLAADASRVITIDGSQLAGGLYFYRVTGERFSTTGNVTLVR